MAAAEGAEDAAAAAAVDVLGACWGTGVIDGDGKDMRSHTNAIGKHATHTTRRHVLSWGEKHADSACFGSHKTAQNWEFLTRENENAVFSSLLFGVLPLATTS